MLLPIMGFEATEEVETNELQVSLIFISGLICIVTGYIKYISKCVVDHLNK